MSTDLAVEAAGLRKSYGSTEVLRGVDLAIPRGSVFALLGPNGAGKTTMVRILTTLSRPDAGAAAVAGFDVVSQRRQVRRCISLAGQYAAVDAGQTGAENLRMMGRLAGLTRLQAITRALELLAEFGLTEVARRRAGTYSGGLRRRLDLAAALVGRPQVLFLDEPTTGLDLPGRQGLWRVITDLAGSGMTIFLTTQYLEEADQLADRVAVLDGGRLVADDIPRALKRQVGGQRLDLSFASGPACDAASVLLGNRVVHRDPAGRVLGVPTDGSAAELRALLAEVDPAGDRVRAVAVKDTSLDDVFLTLTGHRARQAQKEITHV